VPPWRFGNRVGGYEKKIRFIFYFSENIYSKIFFIKKYFAAKYFSIRNILSVKKYF